MHAELLLNLVDFERYLWNFGDATPDRSAPLTTLIDGDAELDEDYRISLGDVVIACGVDMALLALPLSRNRRTNLKVIWPTVQGFVYRSNNARLREAMSLTSQWIDGHDNVDLAIVKNICQEISREVNSGRLAAIEKQDYTIGVYDITAPTYDINALLEWCADYAREREPREENNEYYNSPRYIVDIVNQMYERDDYHYRSDIDTLLTARIVHMSPPHALIGSGHSEGFEP